MEKVFKRVLLIILVTVITIIISLSFIVNHLHSRVAMVTEINEEENLITVTCANGNMFQFTDIEDWMCGDLCSMIMYDKGTEIVEDDIIISSRYGGYLELFETIEDAIN